MSRKRNREIQFAPLQLRPQAPGVGFGETHFNLWVTSLVLSQEWRHQTLERQGGHADSYDSFVSAAQRAGAFAERLGAAQKVATTGQEVFAFACKNEATGAALEERDAKLGFKIADLPR
jgi:hypothetical protein